MGWTSRLFHQLEGRIRGLLQISDLIEGEPGYTMSRVLAAGGGARIRELQYGPIFPYIKGNGR